MINIVKLVPAPNGWICTDDPGEPGRNEPRWSVHNIEAKLLSELFRNLDVLEIGTGLGVSTREIAKQARHVYTVDIDPWVKENIKPTLPGNVYFYESIMEFLEYTPSNTIIDAAFIDGQHTYEAVMQDIADAKRIVKTGGLLLFHDTNMETVQRALKDSHVACIQIKTPVGMGLAWNT